MLYRLVDVGRSLAADRRSKSKTVAKPGYGDQGDQAEAGHKEVDEEDGKEEMKDFEHDGPPGVAE